MEVSIVSFSTALFLFLIDSPIAALNANDTYSIVANFSAAYPPVRAPCLDCPARPASPELVVLASEVFSDANTINPRWLADTAHLKDRTSVYFDLWWSACEPEENTWVRPALFDQIALAARAGYRIAIGPGLHKSPDYCYQKYGAYWVNAHGQGPPVDPEGLGCNLAFYPATWQRVQAYFAQIRGWLAAANATLSILRIGFSQFGEFNYPLTHTGNDWFAFGPGGAALASYPPTLQAFRPGTATDLGTAQTFIAWYLETLAAVQNELVGYVLQLFPATQAAMLYPNRETLIADLNADTARLAAGDAGSSGTSFGWVRALLVPRLLQVAGPGTVLVWCTSAMAGQAASHNLDMLASFAAYATHLQPPGAALTIRVAAENEGGAVSTLDQFRQYSGYAIQARANILFYCCMSIAGYDGDAFYPLVAGAAEVSAQRTVMCSPSTMHGPDDSVFSPDLAFFLRLQGDGNLVVYATNTSANPAPGGTYWQGAVIWTAGTAGQTGCSVVLQSNGGASAVLVNSAGTVLARSDVVPCTLSKPGPAGWPGPSGPNPNWSIAARAALDAAAASATIGQCLQAPSLTVSADGGALQITTDLHVRQRVTMRRV